MDFKALLKGVFEIGGELLKLACENSDDPNTQMLRQIEATKENLEQVCEEIKEISKLKNQDNISKKQKKEYENEIYRKERERDSLYQELNDLKIQRADYLASRRGN